MKRRGTFVFALLCAVILLGASFASAAVESVRCILWQGDTNRYHTAISGTETGGETEPVPDSITFGFITTECGVPGTWEFFLNGTSLGTTSSDPTHGCTCTPGLQTFAVTGALIDSAWDTNGPNILRAVLTGNTYVSWVGAEIVTGSATKRICIYQYAEGGCGNEDLCSAGYTNGPVDASKSTLDTGDDQPLARLKGVIKTTNTDAVWYKWVFGDGSETGVNQLSGSSRYNVEVEHTYIGAVGTPFTAQLMVDGVDNTMSNAVSDNYLVKMEEDNLDSRVNIAIDNGLWGLYQRMTYSDGTANPYATLNSQPCAVWEYGGWVYASPTASAIQAFMINNHKEIGNGAEDPYVEAVRWGMNWLLNGSFNSSPMLRAVSISTQHGSDNPDANGNTYGIEVGDYGYLPIYQGGMIMDALVASGTPAANSGRDFDGNGTPDTYGQILQDMSDMYAYGQHDTSNGAGSYYGGWRYNWGDWPDNSACQWAAIGMIPAQQAPWNGTVPDWVKTYNDTWLNYSFYPWDSGGIQYGGFGYTGAGYGDATTPSGMVQLDFVGATTSDPRWVRSERSLADSWPTWINSGNMYAYYAFAKAMRLANPAPVETFASNGFNWYRDTTSGMAAHLVETQLSNGEWTDYWAPGSLSTAWGVIILKPALFAAAPHACFTAHPNPSYPDLPILFDPGCSGHTETGKDIDNLTKFEWDFDNDGVYDQTTTTPVDVSHSFPCATLPCTYPVTLKVTDDADPALTDTHTLDIRITDPPHPPVADAGGPYVVSLCADDILTLDGSASYDPNEGQHESGCTTCPNDTITAWDWDLIPPLTQFNDESGETVTLDASAIASYFPAGAHQIGLQVTDDTAASYPASGQANMKDADFSQVTVYDSCGAGNLSAEIGCNSVELSWGVSGTYDVLRSTEGPNSGFTRIGSSTGTDYSDGTVSDGTTYYYRLMGDGCMSSPLIITYVADPALCACVDDLAARPKSGKVQLTWTHTGADSYNVYRGTSMGGPYVFLANTASTYCTYLDSAVVNGTTYYYVVRQMGATGAEVCQSNEASATPQLRTR